MARSGASARQSSRGRGSTGVGAHPTMRKKSKLVVTFNPEKRKEYLTGFHKRKQERRRFGLDMEAYKVKKLQLEAKKNRRAEQKEKLAALNLLSDDEKTKEEEEEEADEEEEEASETKRTCVSLRSGDAKAVVNVTTFSDDFTQGKFGDVVTVTTAVGDVQSDSDDSDSSVEAVEEAADDTAGQRGSGALRAKKWKVDPEQHLTLFQRIQQQRKGKALPSKRSKLKEARTARKAMMGKKGNSSGIIGPSKKRGAEDGDGAGTAVGKLRKKLKMKRSQSTGQKRQKQR
uniref:Nucleolar protein 12 n=1 Tax=Peronospora matthiolae TaxID=2874970 RepID=A0AAV1TBI1_9STRA